MTRFRIAGQPPGAVLALGLGLTVGELTLFIVPLLVGNVMERYGMLEEQVGFVIFTRLSALALTSLALAQSIHRFDLRKLAMLGMLVIGITNLLTGLTESAVGYTLARTVLGIGEGMALTAITAVAARAEKPEKIFSLMAGTIASVGIVAYLAIPPALAKLGLPATFTAIGVLSLAATPLLRHLPATSVRSTGKQQIRTPWSAAGICTLAALLMLDVGANTPWYFIERIGHNIGMTLAEVGQALVFVSAIVLVAPVAAYLMGARFGHFAPLSAGFVLLAVASLLTTHSANAFGFTAGIVLSSAVLGFCSIYLLGLAAKLDDTGSLAAAARGFIAIGNAIAPGLGAGILALGGNYRVLGWSSVLLAIAAIGLVYAATRPGMGRANPLKSCSPGGLAGGGEG